MTLYWPDTMYDDDGRCSVFYATTVVMVVVVQYPWTMAKRWGDGEGTRNTRGARGIDGRTLRRPRMTISGGFFVFVQW